MPSTTIAAGSNGQSLPQATINVASTATFSAVGTFVVIGQTISYTGLTGTSFTGCSGGTGALATGQAVAADDINIPVWNATQGKLQPRVLKAQFGDGYEQRAQDGINTGLKTWNVTWANISHIQLKALYDVLYAKAGWQKFTWTQPPPFAVEGSLTWICEDFDWVYNGGLIMGLRAVFLQRPNL